MARQRPGTANGIVFILLEDEYGTINLIVPAEVYERHRLTVRTEPLMLAAGKLERFAAAGGAINVLVDRVGRSTRRIRSLAEIKDFSMLDEQVRRGLAEQRRGAERPEPSREHRGRGLPRRRATGHELRVGSAAMRRRGLASRSAPESGAAARGPMSRPPARAR